MTQDFFSAYKWTSQVVGALRRSLDAQRFDEILPAILSERYEPGARHAIAVLGCEARPDMVLSTGSQGQSRVSVTAAGGWTELQP